MLKDTSYQTNGDTAAAKTGGARPRLTATEIVEKYNPLHPEIQLTYQTFNARANKRCSALDGRVACINGKWQVVGARIFEAIDEPRDTGLRGPVLVQTFDPHDAELFVAALVKLKENEHQLAINVASRIPRQPRALTSRTPRIQTKRPRSRWGKQRPGVSTQQLEHWAKYCRYFERGFFRRTPIIDPCSNRGFDWIYDAVDEATIREARRVEKEQSPRIDLTKPVPLSVAVKHVELTEARTGKRMNNGTAVRYLKEQITKGNLDAIPESDPKRGGKRIGKVTIENVSKLQRTRRSSWPKPPLFKVYNHERYIPTSIASEITGLSEAQLRHCENNPDSTPGRVDLHKRNFEIDGRPRAYWRERDCKAIAKAIDEGKLSPKLLVKFAALIAPPVKVINGERYVPTREALPLTRCKHRNDLLVLNRRTDKPRREPVKVGAWTRDYWHEGDCKEEGERRKPIEESPLEEFTQEKQPTLAAPTPAADDQPRVRLIEGENAAMVCGVRKKLTPRRRQIVEVLLEAGKQRMVLSTLQGETVDDAPKILKEMAKDEHWARVIHFPGGVKGVGYGIF